jgi:hypothetical protein
MRQTAYQGYIRNGIFMPTEPLPEAEEAVLLLISGKSKNPNNETLKAIMETDEAIEKGEIRYFSEPSEMFAALEAEEND